MVCPKFLKGEKESSGRALSRAWLAHTSPRAVLGSPLSGAPLFSAKVPVKMGNLSLQRRLQHLPNRYSQDSQKSLREAQASVNPGAIVSYFILFLKDLIM